MASSDWCISIFTFPNSELLPFNALIISISNAMNRSLRIGKKRYCADMRERRIARTTANCAFSLKFMAECCSHHESQTTNQRRSLQPPRDQYSTCQLEPSPQL